MRMKWINTIIITFTLLIGAYSLTACTKGNAELYDKYIQLANHYEEEALVLEERAKYYFYSAEQLQDTLSEYAQYEYDEMMYLHTTHRENAEKYHKIAEQYRLLAVQYQ